MDEKTTKTLRRYLVDMPGLPNESAKTHRFVALLEELFPGADQIARFTAGIENVVHIDIAGSRKLRRVDAYYGNAVIEFEKSLAATEATARHQLTEQALGVWAKEGKENRPLVCVASDGIVWKSFVPRLKKGVSARPQPSDVELEPLREIVVSEKSLHDFWIWLTSLIFRPGQVEPTAERFRVDFGATSLAFADAREALRAAWNAASARPEPQVAFDTWKRYLTVTYGSVEAGLEELFLKHTYLVSVARLLVWASLSRGRGSASLRETARAVLSGEFFDSLGIENVVEDDFFQWVRDPKAEEALASVWERTLDQLLTYDLACIDQDILKGVYQDLVDPKDRHDLGEYYTPDWLCDRIVAKLLPEKGFVSVLDPTCGSGSFLRAAITHFLATNPSGGDATRLRSILDHVVGIDIHPVAVTIARATYLLAIRSLVKATKRPIQIPVYLADSLFLPSEVEQPLIGAAPSYEIRFGGDKKVSIPEELVRAPELFDSAIAACAEVAVEHAKSHRDTVKTFEAFLRRSVPEIAEHKNASDMREALWTFTEELSDLIRKQKNSIWAFIVRNAYRPAMFRERFDVIVGNPPWLSYRYISDPEYQAEVKRRAVVDYKIAPKSQKLMTQMELASVFLVHSLATFGKPGSRIGFVMPRSVLSADQHANLRSGQFEAPLKLEEYWDLADVRPVFNVPACVLFASKPTWLVNLKVNREFSALEWAGALPRRDLPWAEAREALSAKERKAKLIFLGSRNAISTSSGEAKARDASPYAKRFRQGATLVPRNFYFVRLADAETPIDPDRIYWAETDPEQAERSKPPYAEIRMKGKIEGRFLFNTVLSKHVLPFILLPPPIVLLPVVQHDGGELEVRTAGALRADGYREIAKWMTEAEKLWIEKRDRKASRETSYDWLDYQGKLTAQNARARHLVLYNAAGTNLSAVHVARKNRSLPFVVEHKLYWAACDSAGEADYLAAVLNADVVNAAIKPFQSRGLMGERDIEKKVLELPIPEFDKLVDVQSRIAALGAQAANEAAKAISGQELPRSLARRRGFVREALRGTLEEINREVRKLL